MMSPVSTPSTPATIANARNTRNHPGVNGSDASAIADASPTISVVTTRYASRSSATAAVA